jgi:hypothetical protein
MVFDQVQVHACLRILADIMQCIMPLRRGGTERENRVTRYNAAAAAAAAMQGKEGSGERAGAVHKEVKEMRGRIRTLTSTGR